MLLLLLQSAALAPATGIGAGVSSTFVSSAQGVSATIVSTFGRNVTVTPVKR